jgi:serine/threonine protein kinase
MILAIGQTISNRYEILSMVGSGGFAQVYKARDLQFGRIVAIKVLTTELTPNDPTLARFEREAQILSRLKHKNLPIFYGFGQDNGRPYLVSELIKGVSLATLLLPGKPLSIPHTVALINQVCAALSCAHAHDIVHRDISASNVLLTESEGGGEIVKLIDFGLATGIGADGNGQKLTEAGIALGSLCYMSPEQCLGAKADRQSDIYALACLLHHCLTGAPPFEAQSPEEIMTLHLHDSFPRLREQRKPAAEEDDPLVLQSLQSVIDRASRKKPEERYPSVERMIQDLQSAVHGSVTSAPPPTKSKLPALSRTNCVLLLISALALVGTCCWHWARTHQDPPFSKPKKLTFFEFRRILEEAYTLTDKRKGVAIIEAPLRNGQLTGARERYMAREFCSVAYNQLHDFPTALKLEEDGLREMKSDDPGWLSLNLLRAETLHGLHRTAEALRLLHQLSAVSLKKDVDRANALLAQISHANEELFAAKPYLLQAYKKYPDHCPRVIAWLIEIDNRQHHWDNVLAYYERLKPQLASLAPIQQGSVIGAVAAAHVELGREDLALNIINEFAARLSAGAVKTASPGEQAQAFYAASAGTRSPSLRYRELQLINAALALNLPSDQRGQLEVCKINALLQCNQTQQALAEARALLDSPVYKLLTPQNQIELCLLWIQCNLNANTKIPLHAVLEQSKSHLPFVPPHFRIVKSEQLARMEASILWREGPRQKAVQLLETELAKTISTEHKQWCLCALCDYYFHLNDINRLRTLVPQAVQQFPDDPQLVSYVANLHFLEGDLAACRADYSRVKLKRGVANSGTVWRYYGNGLQQYLISTGDYKPTKTR